MPTTIVGGEPHGHVYREDAKPRELSSLGDDYPARLYITFEYDLDKVSFSKKLKFKAGQVV